jgi:hypothetical protein
MTHSNPTLEQVARLQARSERLQRLREMLKVLIASEARVGPLELGALLEVADSAVAPSLCKAVHQDYGKDGGQQCELPAEPKHTLHRMNCVQWENETADWSWKAIESSVKVLDDVAAPPASEATADPNKCANCGHWIHPPLECGAGCQCQGDAPAAVAQSPEVAPTEPPTDAPDDGDPNPLPECPMCGANGEASVQWVEDRFKYGMDGPKQIELVAVIPLWTCNICGESWTDYHAEDARDSTVRKHLSSRSKSPQEQPTDAPGVVDLEKAAFPIRIRAYPVYELCVRGGDRSWPNSSGSIPEKAVPLSVAQTAVGQAINYQLAERIKAVDVMQDREAETGKKWINALTARVEAAETALATERERADSNFQSCERIKNKLSEAALQLKAERAAKESAEIALAKARNNTQRASDVALRHMLARESAEREAAGLRERLGRWLPNVAQLIDAFKQDAISGNYWSDWDEQQRLELTEIAALIAPPHVGGEEDK